VKNKIATLTILLDSICQKQ